VSPLRSLLGRHRRGDVNQPVWRWWSVEVSQLNKRNKHQKLLLTSFLVFSSALTSQVFVLLLWFPWICFLKLTGAARCCSAGRWSSCSHQSCVVFLMTHCVCVCCVMTDTHNLLLSEVVSAGTSRPLFFLPVLKII